MKIEYRKPYCDDFLAEYYRIHDLSDFDELFSEVKNLESTNPEFRYLITLDDFGQASYTSMHSKMFNSLDNGEWLSEESIDESWFEDEYLREDLSFEQRFYIRRLGFKHGLASTKFEDIFDKLIYLDEDSRKETIEGNQDPISLVDKEIYLLKVQVEFCYQSIYAFPNGYFSSDLSPFENYHLAKYLEENYGYGLFGIGASYLLFKKQRKLNDSSVEQLVDFLAKLYIEDEDVNLLEFFKEQILTKEHLLIRYSE